jgi:hypothetical protein
MKPARVWLPGVHAPRVVCLTRQSELVLNSGIDAIQLAEMTIELAEFPLQSEN